MRWIVLLLSVFLALSILNKSASAEQAYVYTEVSQGIAFSSNWIGNHPTSLQAGVHVPINEHQYLRFELQHISNIGRGCNLQIGDDCKWMADEREETWLNQGTVTYGVRFNL